MGINIRLSCIRSAGGIIIRCTLHNVNRAVPRRTHREEPPVTFPYRVASILWVWYLKWWPAQQILVLRKSSIQWQQNHTDPHDWEGFCLLGQKKQVRRPPGPPLGRLSKLKMTQCYVKLAPLAVISIPSKWSLHSKRQQMSNTRSLWSYGRGRCKNGQNNAVCC